ncbi:2'-5' RNA ligase family protein [Phototrophicus methaneseepsis]|uniref:2'-5' RNA ligase family protein n=1 Tax=Phototrophicus methaneseepsis TaxID=2710758 RepID=A0A7S8EDI7_9CHLR|nr:2'-5' RNA ligase family protein [Phototrophicus methaneseepsis]QPC84993.1 2'-5' RNA ligase family protein [Phototrophicus methaneseepsis]
MPNGVLTLLDEATTRHIQALWQEITALLGKHPEPNAPFPHFTYHGADRYDITALNHAMAALAMEIAPFTVTTSGLGLFTIPMPVLYIPVVRSPRLTALHERVWQIADKYAHEASPYYQPTHWMPHITLAHSGIERSDLPKLISLLSERRFTWEIEVTNFAITDTKQDQPHQIPQYTLSLCANGACE